MPLYEYHCSQCECNFDTLRGMDERQFCPCPACGSIANLVLSPCNFKCNEGLISVNPNKVEELRREAGDGDIFAPQRKRLHETLKARRGCNAHL